MHDDDLNTLSAADAPQGAIRLHEWGVIRAEGADAVTFLQGQLTQDIAKLGPDRAALAGYCLPKGRLLASFVMWKPASDVVLLACSADLLAPTLKRLSMYVLRARCKLSDASAALGLWGVVGKAPTLAWGPGVPDDVWRTTLAGTAQLLRLPDAAIDDAQSVARYLVAAPADDVPAWLAAAAPLSVQDWHRLEVQAGVVRIAQATVEHFVPQMVNFELVGGVDFQKGCYPGQEIVARAQYRGTVKRRAFLYEADVPLTAGDEVFDAGDPGQPAGSIALAADGADGRHVALIELKLTAAEAGQVHLRSADGPKLERRPLPYPLPNDVV